MTRAAKLGNAKGDSAKKRRLRAGHRDVDVLKMVDQHVCLSTSQLAELFSSVKKASERLKELAAGGLLRHERRAWTFGDIRHECFYSLTVAGRKHLMLAGEAVAPLPMPAAGICRNLEHLASVNQFFILLRDACSKSDGMTCEFVPAWRLAGRATSMNSTGPGNGIGPTLTSTLKPDAVVCLRNKRGKALLAYLEIDRASEPVSRPATSAHTSLGTKIQRYCNLFDCKDYQADGRDLFGYTPEGFRVLLVTTDEGRIDALRHVLMNMGDTRFVWVTTFKSLAEAGPFSQIWQILFPGESGRHSLAGSYRHPDAVKDPLP